MTTSTSNFDAQTALNQLCQGPTGRLKVMVGATNFSRSDADEYVQFHFKSCRKANVCRVQYDAGLDLYNLEFYKLNRKTYDCPKVESFDGVYCDQLKELFENFTGLYLSL